MRNRYDVLAIDMVLNAPAMPKINAQFPTGATAKQVSCLKLRSCKELADDHCHEDNMNAFAYAEILDEPIKLQMNEAIVRTEI